MRHWMHLYDRPVTTTPPLPWRVDPDGRTVAQRIAADTARAIAERVLAEGAVVTEVELSTTHGASRTPAREAMLQLEAWGLVRLLPKKGAVVTAVSMEERRDLLAVRALFESDAVAALGSSARLVPVGERLAAALLQQRAAVEAADRLAFAEADIAFHAEIILAGGNAVVAALLQQLAPRFARLTYAVALEAPDRLGLMLDEHERLAGLARSGDADAFGLLLRRHIAAGHFPQEAFA
jgi:DNA-binding GntR family transcriptional regulator